MSITAERVADITKDKWGDAFGADYLAIMNGSMYGGIGPGDTAYAVTDKEEYAHMAMDLWDEMAIESDIADVTWDQAVEIYKECESYNRLEMLGIPELLSLVEENTPESFVELSDILFEAGDILDEVQ